MRGFQQDVVVKAAVPAHQQHKVWSTWNESRTEEFPQILEYRGHWERFGFEVAITPNSDIRQDVEALVRETQAPQFLQAFDSLATTNMQYDFWRYAKLYLNGGIYADVDVDPLTDIAYWQALAEEQNKVVIFEETASFAANSTLMELLRPYVTNFQEFPSYASCVLIAPAPKAPFFLDLIHTIHPDQWVNVPEPTRTLMTAGPGLLTRFAKTRRDVIMASKAQGKLSYVHNGFGTWKSKSTVAFDRYLNLTMQLSWGVFVFGVVQVLRKWNRQRRRRDKMEPFRKGGSSSTGRKKSTTSICPGSKSNATSAGLKLRHSGIAV
ncbi:Glycosyltransferase sugar-binding region containing DXD motif [Seminavis robusta]|uniref:Glycosyltransferase sugar-binding region containing DXD motif n=1 Tax=Seminavis robusta TaxID=568900 RepID=A0A9N8HE80_9STRA|nr:Glycosyltransferase sugar-binding region containing DXD motif [Seminavis robusta]|eukprot:Sro376_g129690.1 Glycosyltransferase sugar-binding region containing DXD motif (322) ;mRNA; f:26970-27935